MSWPKLFATVSIDNIDLVTEKRGMLKDRQKYQKEKRNLEFFSISSEKINFWKRAQKNVWKMGKFVGNDSFQIDFSGRDRRDSRSFWLFWEVSESFA